MGFMINTSRFNNDHKGIFSVGQDSTDNMPTGLAGLLLSQQRPCLEVEFK
jgi:hypothetical protein